MVLAAAAAIAVWAPSTASATKASAQATATIRVVSGVRLSFGVDQSDAGLPHARDTVLKMGDKHQPARLIEFQ